MTENPAEVVEEAGHPPRPASRHWRRFAVVSVVLGLLFGVPWWTLVFAPAWPVPVLVAATLVFAVALVALPLLMFTGHGKHRDVPAAIGDVLLGVIWVVFVWSLLGNIARLVLIGLGIDDPLRSRLIAATVLMVSTVLLAWGHYEAMRIPRVRRVPVRMPRLGPGLDGLRVAIITDTHYGPINRARWSAAMVERVNELDADIVCHVGDIADGTVEMRREQADGQPGSAREHFALLRHEGLVRLGLGRIPYHRDCLRVALGCDPIRLTDHFEEQLVGPDVLEQ